MAVTVEKCQILETSAFFANVPTSVREAILSTARRRRYSCGETVFLINDPIEEIFLVMEGCTKVTQPARNGTEVVLRIAAPGELVGELGVEPGNTHSSTAQAIEECEVLVWGTETFEAALVRFPVLQRNVNDIQRRRISEMEGRISEMKAAFAEYLKLVIL